MGSVGQQRGVYYASNATSSAINDDPIVKEPSVAILSHGGVVPGLPDSFNVSSEAAYCQEGW